MSTVVSQCILWQSPHTARQQIRHRGVRRLAVSHPGAAVPAPVVWTTTLFVLLRHPTLGSGDTSGHGHWAPDGEGQTAPAEDRWLTLQHSRGEGCLKMMSHCHWVCKTARELAWPLWQVININEWQMYIDIYMSWICVYWQYYYYYCYYYWHHYTTLRQHKLGHYAIQHSHTDDRRMVAGEWGDWHTYTIIHQ